MSKLHVLPVQLANMIAAGEVVQRPASVVKELMENAVDAGATDIKVIISDAGRTLIQVIDNGIGMSPADAVLCFERHATSKISTIDDLSAIESYGFRGVFTSMLACCVAALAIFPALIQEKPAYKNMPKTQIQKNSGSAINPLLVYIFFRGWGISVITAFLPIYLSRMDIPPSKMALPSVRQLHLPQ